MTKKKNPRNGPRDNVRKRVTLRSIAEALSVTPATVSKALRDSSDISSETKEMVKKVSDKLGYRPNFLARSLINNRSKILGVIVPHLRISFFAEALRGMYEEINRRGYECVFLVHDEIEANMKQKLEFLYDIHADGILLNPTGGKTFHPLLRKMTEEGTRIVCWDRYIPDFSFRWVKIDDEDASFKLTSRIIGDGKKRIMFLGPNQGISLLKDRFSGYKKALKNNGIPFSSKLVIESLPTVEDSYSKVMSAIKKGIEFDAIVSIGGLMTYGAGRAILEHKRRIPDEVVLGEFGDNDIVYKLGIPFYSVVQNPKEIGVASTDLLIKMLETGKPDMDFGNILMGSRVMESGTRSLP